MGYGDLLGFILAILIFRGGFRKKEEPKMHLFLFYFFFCSYFSMSVESHMDISLVDGGGLRTFFCDPMHTLRSSGYTLSGICIDDLRMSPRRKFP